MRRQFSVAIFTLGFTLAAVTAFAAPPMLITVQGKLTDASGNPLAAGAKSFVFRMFNASSGGIQIWPPAGGEAQNISSNSEGLWSGALGAVNPLTDAVFADSVRWLEITVNAQLLPRVRILTGPYALRVATVDGATGGQVSGKITTTGVGDGVEIHGPGLGNANEAYIRFADQNGTQFGYVGDANPGNPDIYVVSLTGAVHLYSVAGTALTASANGYVGIGTNSPVYQLDVLSSTIGIRSTSTGSNTSAVFGVSNQLNGIGIYGSNSVGFAGVFNGDVDVEGTLTKDAGSFKIDHPLDPANKYLSHSFVESPDMMNIYNGIAVTDDQGDAIVTMPDWFESLNRDFRYQLTVMGQFAQAIVADEIKGNQFSIRTDKPNVKVSWQVTGIRQDAYANAHRIPVEELKPSAERGFYRNPELFNQSEEKGIDWAHHPEMMKQMKEEREKAADGAE